MGKTTIEWADYTFNPWWGCSRVSPGCLNCYAETWAARFGTEWGPEAPRRFFGEGHWHQPLAWNETAAKEGVRRRVFAASMGDVFEDRRDLDAARDRLLLGRVWQVTPWLDWLLLTKRPENVRRMVPHSWLDSGIRGSHWPSNAWIGASAENEAALYRVGRELLGVPVKAPTPELGFRGGVRFLSCEPLLGPLYLAPLLGANLVSWVIVGGESGARARPMHPAWVRSIRDQCQNAGVPFFFKQWGEWCPLEQAPVRPLEEQPPAREIRRLLPSGEWSTCLGDSAEPMERLGKKKSGAFLDGREWRELPPPFETEAA